MYSNMRKVSMSQNDPDEFNQVISMDSGPFNLSDQNRAPKKISSPCSDFHITLDNLSNNFKSVEKLREVQKSPNFKESETPEFRAKTMKELDELDFVKKKKDYYSSKLLNDQRNNLKQNFHLYQKSWIDTLIEQNPQCERCKKELITLNRFNYNIDEIKNLDWSIQVSEHASIPIYHSDSKMEVLASPESPAKTVTVPLTQVVCNKSLKQFDVQQVASLFNYLNCSDKDTQCLNSMVIMNTNEIDSLMVDQKYCTTKKKPNEPLQETCMFTTLMLDSDNKIDVFVKSKKFMTKTDGVFNLITLAEIDVVNKVTTGSYIIMKLSEQKDLELEQSMMIE